jgi:hypothetical protein
LEAQNSPATIHERRVQEHKQNSEFRCHHPGCNKRTTGPVHEQATTTRTRKWDSTDREYYWLTEHSYAVWHYDVPKNLIRCSGCQQWFCIKHLASGKCRSCSGY